MHMSPECLEPLAVGHQAFGSWLERQRYAAPGDTADSVAVPWLHSYRSGFSREQGCDYVYDDVLYMLA